MKTSFVIGSLGTGANVLTLADDFGLLQDPAHIIFTIVIGFVFMFLGGVTMIMLNKWINKKLDKVEI